LKDIHVFTSVFFIAEWTKYRMFFFFYLGMIANEICRASRAKNQIFSSVVGQDRAGWMKVFF
jgi:hypothetical protein